MATRKAHPDPQADIAMALGAKRLKMRSALMAKRGIADEDEEEVPMNKKASGRR